MRNLALILAISLLAWEMASAAACIPPRPYMGAFAYKAADQGSLAAMAYNKVTFLSEGQDPQAAFASSTYTAPRAGRYRINSLLCFSSDALSATLGVLYVNGARVTTATRQISVPANTLVALPVEYVATLGSNDTVEIYEWHSAGTATVWGATGDTGQSSLDIEYLGQ